jgi:hypothetical protein
MPTVDLELPRAGMNQHELINYIMRLVAELNYTLNNLDGQNVGRAGIPAQQITNFNGQSIKVMQAEFDKVRAGRAEANYISSLVAKFAMAAIERATITAANIKDLTTETLKAVLADLEKVTAGSIESRDEIGLCVGRRDEHKICVARRDFGGRRACFIEGTLRGTPCNSRCVRANSCGSSDCEHDQFLHFRFPLFFDAQHHVARSN